VRSTRRTGSRARSRSSAHVLTREVQPERDPTSCVGGADRAGVDGVGSVPSVVRAGVVLVLSVSSAHAARPWSVQFGGCVFSGDFDGAPIVRTGSCPTQAGSLDSSMGLYNRLITS
jgi:hypothetical protein